MPHAIWEIEVLQRIPDHTAALDDIDCSLGNVRAWLAGIEQTPAVSLTPAEMAEQVNFAVQTMRASIGPPCVSARS